MSARSTRGQLRAWLAPLALLAIFAALGWIAWRHRDYYAAPLAEQPLDARHPRLRSSGAIGLTMGLAAALLMVVNLAYLVRRRFAAATRLGSLRSWMDLHVVSGLAAGGCVVIHAAGHLRSASAAVASGALAIVLATGLLGRFLFAQLPRRRDGQELSLEEARARFEELRAELAGLGLPPLSSAEFGAATEASATTSKLRALLRLVGGDREARAAHRRYLAQLGTPVPDDAARRRVRPALDRILREVDRLARLRELSALLASWRFLHRWLALVMVGTALCHVALALRYGALRWDATCLRELLRAFLP